MLLVYTAALALMALPGILAAGTARGIPGESAAISAGSACLLVSTVAAGAPSDAEAGDDADDSPDLSLTPFSTTGLPDPKGAGGPGARPLSIAGRDSVSRPLCRGRPPRAPRAMTPSRAALISGRLLLAGTSRLLPDDPDPRRLSPHLRP